MIGIFDSGVGGLTVLKHLLKKLPDYDYIYLGDNARAPYGGRSQDTIYEYTREAVDFLFSRGSKLIILACNTASSQALRKIQQEYLPKKYPGKNVLGVIRPLVEKAVEGKYKKIAVLGTKATIESGVYKKEIKKLNEEIKVFEKCAPLLVPLIEEGWTGKPETKKILKNYLRSLKNEQVDYLILACTHYPFLLDEIRKIMTKRCTVDCPGIVIAESLAAYLERHEELGIKKTANPVLNFYTTDSVEIFRKIGEKFLGQEIRNIEKAII